MNLYNQQRFNEVNVCGKELIAAAADLASHLNVTDFKGSDGWLWRFRNRHGSFSEVLHGDVGDADASGAPFP